jgi:catechol 2,3-dioxygenase-like lactoylglutathione lyase family enzyme
MTVALDHTIIAAKDRWESARFLAGILGLTAGPEWARFVPVQTGNGVSLDFADSPDVRSRHFAFLVGEAEFDAALARIKAAGVAFHAEFDGRGPGEINHHYGGRGVYFHGPEGHLFEIITKPYGPVPER